LNLSEGFNLVNTPLDSDGTGTNTTVVGVYSNTLPVNAQIYVYSGGTYSVATYAENKAKTATNWTANLSINPGLGYWISIPTGAFGGGTSNYPVVGTVLQGNLSNPTITGPGYFIVGNQVPIGGSITTNLNYVPAVNDQVFLYNGAGYNSYTYAENKAKTATNWAPSVPSVNVGQGFWLNSASGTPWTNNFTVQ
jgi:hypothetical protein